MGGLINAAHLRTEADILLTLESSLMHDQPSHNKHEAENKLRSQRGNEAATTIKVKNFHWSIRFPSTDQWTGLHTQTRKSNFSFHLKCFSFTRLVSCHTSEKTFCIVCCHLYNCLFISEVFDLKLLKNEKTRSWCHDGGSLMAAKQQTSQPLLKYTWLKYCKNTLNWMLLLQ